MASAPSVPPVSIIRERVTSLQLQQGAVAIAFSNQTKLLVSPLLAKQIAVGDEITFSVAMEDSSRTEVLITKSSRSGSSRHVYQAAIGYVTHPKQDKRKEHFVSAEVQPGSLGIRAIFLPCDVLREHFYHSPQNNDEADR